ncbi:LysM peptidoglycan-binding domain-containing protein [Thermincola ferriacetica]
MRIHVVRRGDTVYALARNYGVTVESIINTNGLQDIPYLIIGQALVIPTTEFIYVVRPGDTLWLLSRRFNVSINRIVELNRIVNPNLIYPGMRLRIPETTKTFGTIEVNGYIEPSSAASETRTIDEVGRYLTYISPFSHTINEDGSLNPINDSVILTVAGQYRVSPLLVTTNFRNGNFDSSLVHGLLTSDKAQENYIKNVLALLKNKGYYGLNIDFERIPPADRQLYNSFLGKVVAALHAENYPVSTALAPKPFDIKTGEWHGAHDYKAHGEIVDFVVLMAYEWGWAGGPPLAVAPLNEVKAVLDYAVSVIPAKKILLGVPLYGYNWTLPYTPGGPWAPRISPHQALRLAARYGATIQFDEVAQSPFFNYRDENGNEHVVWFEDARSVQAKYRLAAEYGLRGISYWVLGLYFPENWIVLDNMFQIVKFS